MIKAKITTEKQALEDPENRIKFSEIQHAKTRSFGLKISGGLPPVLTDSKTKFFMKVF